MDKVPHITFTEEIWRNAEYAAGMSPWQIANKAIEIALAEQATEQPKKGSEWYNPTSFIDKEKERQEQPLITADEARKLGAGKAEWSDKHSGGWVKIVSEDFSYLDYNWFNGQAIKYRAIKQTEPVDPHAELKAMYEQQVKDGTLGDFVWECRALVTAWFTLESGKPPPFHKNHEYRCTPKPTCQIRNLDTGELKTMTREAAKKLQAKLGDTVEWFDADGYSAPPACIMELIPERSYTYKLKANPVNLDGELMTREAAIAKWESKKDTHNRYYFNYEFGTSGMVLQSDNYWDKDYVYELRAKLKPTVKLTIDSEPAKMLTPAECEAERLARVDTHDFQRKGPTYDWVDARVECADIIGIEYRLIRKPLKQVSLASVPVRVAVKPKSDPIIWLLHGRNRIGQAVLSNKGSDTCDTFCAEFESLELAPASEQPWIAVQDGKHFETELRVEGLEYHITYGAGVDDAVVRFKVTGLAAGWVLK